MVGRTIFENDLETLAVELIERYLVSYLSKIEIVRPRVTTIQVPDGSCPDTLRAIIRGLDLEVRAFEITYQRAKGAHVPFYSLTSVPIKTIRAI